MTKVLRPPPLTLLPLVLAFESANEMPRECRPSARVEMEFMPDAEERWPMALAESWAIMAAASGRSYGLILAGGGREAGALSSMPKYARLAGTSAVVCRCKVSYSRLTNDGIVEDNQGVDII
jgi:hypothetical protein